MHVRFPYGRRSTRVASGRHLRAQLPESISPLNVTDRTVKLYRKVLTGILKPCFTMLDLYRLWAGDTWLSIFRRLSFVTGLVK